MATRMSEPIWVQTDIFTIRSKLYFQVTFSALPLAIGTAVGDHTGTTIEPTRRQHPSIN